MSATVAAAAEGAETQPANSGGADVEARARQMGWKPQEEFHGRPSDWRSAEEFLARGYESPAVMQDRLNVMTDRMTRMERDNRAVTTKLDEAIGTIRTMTDMARSADRRAYERARGDLERERERAVESGDTATFKRVDGEIRDLDKTAPAPVTQPTAAAAPVAPAPPAQPDPAVTDFYRRNPWYGRDAAMTQEADLIHTGLLNTRRDLSMDQNLQEVERRVRATFPATPAQTANTNTQEAGGDNPRRSEPGAVSPASTGAPARQRGGRRTFANMPEESKAAYRRYKSMLANKGDPLTEEEWATDYWSQFEEEA